MNQIRQQTEVAIRRARQMPVVRCERFRHRIRARALVEDLGHGVVFDESRTW